MANPYFRVLKSDSGEILGFINGTLSDRDIIDHDTMASHVPEGRMLVVHSVTVRESQRRLGIGSGMLSEYMRYIIAERTEVLRVGLLSKQPLVPFYEAAGFASRGLSSVEHGKV